MPQFESGRRLCVLVEAGEVRYAIEATTVLEIANPDPDGESLRGFMEIKDLSVLLGGAPEERPGMAVVLDVSPTLAVRIGRVIEVADLARAPFHLLPSGIGESLSLLLRGAIIHADQPFFELSVDALPLRPIAASPPPAKPVYMSDSPPESALIFESQGRLYGVPLPLVSQVAVRGQTFTRLPTQGGPMAGLFLHNQMLWPIYSAGGLLGASAPVEGFFILTEPAGQNVGLCASRVLGVSSGFSPTDARGEYSARGLPSPAMFLDLQHMFS